MGNNNPEQVMQQMMANNPQTQQALMQIKNMSQGMNMKDFTTQYLKQMGYDPRQIEEMAKIVGAK